MEDILIKISGDTKELIASLGEIGESGESMGDKLKAVGVAAGVAFAGFSASIMGAVYAYRQQEQASIQVNQVILATGGIAGVTAKAVDALAESLESQTTFSKTAVTQAEAMLLTFTRVGSDVFPEATKATADLAAGMHIGLSEAAVVVGRALQDPANSARALRAAHIQLTAAQQAQIKTMVLQGNTAGAQAVILQELQTRYGGMAEAAAKGTGVFEQVKNAMEKLTQAVGAELTPSLIKGATWLKGMIQSAAENKGLVEFIAHALVAATAVTGIVAAIAAAVFAFQKLSAVFALASVAAGAFGISLAAATAGLSLLVAAAALIYTHWNTIWPAMKAIFAAFVANIKSLAMGLGKILIGALTADLGLIKEGWAQAKLATLQGINSVTTAVKAASAQRNTDELKSKDAQHDALMAKNKKLAKDTLDADDALKKAQFKAELAANQATILEEQHHSALLVGLKRQEAADLKILADAEFKGSKAAVQAHLEEVRKLYAQAESTERKRLELQDRVNLQEIGVHNTAIVAAEKAQISLLEKMADVHYQKDRAQLQAELKNQGLLIAREQDAEIKRRQTFDKQTEKITQQYHLNLTQQQKTYLKTHEQQQLASIQTQQTAEEIFLQNQIQMQTQAHNQLLQDQIQFGATYAELNQAMHSTIFQGSKTAFGELENLTQSHNDTLKAIGKVAAAANIIMKTYESAMNIFAGFSTIPIVGYALGIAGAAAAVAFGMEQLGQINSMATGGLVTGGVPGQDSVPAMLMPGELVVPKQNFNDVVRSYAGSQAGQGAQNSQPQKVQVSIDLHPNAARMIQVKNIKDQSMGVFRGTK